MARTFRSFIYSGMIALSMISAALAADLPSSSPPVFDQPILVRSTIGPFVGLRGGYEFKKRELTLGANGGYDFGFGRLEANYDRLGGHLGGNLYTGNVIGQYTFGRFTPYVLGGAGYVTIPTYLQGTRLSYNTPVWNVGTGFRFAITDNISTDVRYRYVQGFNSLYNFGRYRDNLVTAGVEYKF